MLVKPYSICEQIRLSIVMKLYFYLTGSLALTSTAHKLPTCIPTRSIANSGLRGCVRKLPNSNAAITQWSMLFLLVEQRAAPPLLPSVELITLFQVSYMAPIRSERQKKPYAVSFYCVAGVSCLIHRCPQRPRGSDGHWVHDRAPLQTAKANAPANTSSTTKLIVSNLHYEITPKDLVVGILCCS